MKHIFNAVISMIGCFNLFSASPTTSEQDNTPSVHDIAARITEMDIPVLAFTLENGKFPDFDLLETPEGCIGRSITNNEYVNGQLDISRLGESLYNSGPYVAKTSGVRIKVRGNTSANWQGNKVARPGYKIKLSKKANLLLSDGSVAKSKDWVLLKSRSTHLKPVAGFHIARLCGLGWQPRGTYVNLVINGRYMGVYYLIEAITGDKGRIGIDKSGYVIENDPYWWKPDEIYFKTTHLPAFMGWTFKEPDTDDFDETSMASIHWAVTILENALYNDGDLKNLIDFRSFAQWILAHDILYTTDGAGSNIFMIKPDFNHLSPFSSPLKMGPVWDMDTSMEFKEEKFCVIHSSNIFYYSRLFAIPEFQQIYKDLWNIVSPTLVDDVMAYVENHIAANKGLEAARILDYQTYGSVYNTPEVCCKILRQWLESRVQTLHKLINGTDHPLNVTTGLEGVIDVPVRSDIPNHIPSDGGRSWIDQNGVKVFTADGLPSDILRSGLNVIEWPDGTSAKHIYGK